MSSFCNAKATHIFSAKNIKIMYIESAKTVNEMTLNELVKLTTLWTTGPRFIPANTGSRTGARVVKHLTNKKKGNSYLCIWIFFFLFESCSVWKPSWWSELLFFVRRSRKGMPQDVKSIRLRNRDCGLCMQKGNHIQWNRKIGPYRPTSLHEWLVEL